MSTLSPLANLSPETIRILHVDDEPEFADLTGTFLEREDDRFSIETETSASDGLDRLADKQFDCIISDYDMPGKSGIEFLERVREDNPELPFILFTGKGSEEIASDAISAGVTDYLQKESGTDQYTILANRVSNAIDRYQSRRMIERSEAQLRNIIDELPHLLYVVDEDGTYLLANEALAEFHDTTVEAIEGASVTEILDESEAERFLSDLSAVIESGSRKHPPEVKISDSDGTVRILEPRLLPYEVADVATQAVLGIAVDVTQHRQRERERERIRERMDLALEHTGSVIFELDLDTEEVVRHGAFERFFDVSVDEVPTWEDHLERVVHPADQDAFRQFYQEIVDGKRADGELEYRTHPEYGEVSWVRDTVSVTPDTSSETNQAVGIAVDITEPKRQELELQRKERRYEAVFNDPNILVGLIDTDGTVLDINETAMNYVDATLDDLRDEPFWETPWFTHSDAVQQEVQEWIKQAARGEYVRFEADLVRPSGDPYSVEGVFRPVTNDDGEVVSLLISDRDITEQKAHERELEQTNTVLSTLFETLPVGILAEDAERNVLAANNRLFNLFEIPGSPDEAVGTDCEQMALNASEMFVDSEGFIERVDELISDRIPTDGEELSLRDGRVFERSHRPIELPSGDGHLWVYRDITDREHYERTIVALHDTAEDLHRAKSDDQVAEVMTDAMTELLGMPTNGVALHDRSENVLRFAAVTDRTKDVFSDIPTFHPRDSLPWDAFERGETVQYDDVSTVSGRYNSDTPIRSEMIVPLGEHGIAMIGSTEVGEFDDTDVSLVETLARHAETALDRIKREHELRVKTQRLDAILDNTTTLMFMKGDDGRYLFVNHGYRELFDLHDEAIIGKTDREIHPPEVADTVWKNDQMVIERGEPLEIEERVSVDGEERVFLSSKVPIYDTGERSDPDEPVAVFGVASDITELRRREEQLQRERDRLDEFASVVSHDIRNPLTIAEGHLQLIRDECDSEHIEPIDRALTRIDDLIADLLTLAREGEQVNETEVVDLTELSDQCWQTVETEDATLRTSVNRTIKADRSRLAQLLENLIGNAIEHGGEDVTVTVGTLDDGFYVADDGPGIPEADRDSVFDAGYSSAEGGTGFGLSIVKQVANAHGWEIRVTEGSDGGARFEITGVEFVD